MKADRSLRASAPGRICLFGEHQDYLKLPVIPCAISVRVNVEGHTIEDKQIRLDLPDIRSSENFRLEPDIPYGRERDYFKSAVNVLGRHGAVFPRGFTGRVHGNIPINSGTSSSSALLVGWIRILMEISENQLDPSPESVARLAHEAEVVEFNEPGGMMDHFATALGGVFFLDFDPKVTVRPFKAKLGSFILGDSGEPKDTKGILRRVKDQVIEINDMLNRQDAAFSLRRTPSHETEKYNGVLNEARRRLLRGTLENYRITRQAETLLRKPFTDHRELGNLLNRHQDILRDDLNISTPKIDRMIDAALNAGAYGAKINGSGGGGCMFAYAPDDPDRVAEAVRRAGGMVLPISADEGVRLEQPAPEIGSLLP